MVQILLPVSPVANNLIINTTGSTMQLRLKKLRWLILRFVSDQVIHCKSSNWADEELNLYIYVWLYELLFIPVITNLRNKKYQTTANQESSRYKLILPTFQFSKLGFITKILQMELCNDFFNSSFKTK